MPTIEQKLKALLRRWPAVEMCLLRIGKLANEVRQETTEPAEIPYKRREYLMLKDLLGNYLTEIEEPQTEPLPPDLALMVMARVRAMHQNYKMAARCGARYLDGLDVPIPLTPDQKTELLTLVQNAVQTIRDEHGQLP